MPEKYRFVAFMGTCRYVQHFPGWQKAGRTAGWKDRNKKTGTDYRSMDENKIVLCGANAYEKKYYFNEEQFKMIPDSIKQELHVICVLFTEEVGGVFTIAFEEDGNVVMETNADDDDIYYDEISSGLLISEIRRSRQELFESLSLYYRVFIKKEDVSALLDEEDDE